MVSRCVCQSAPVRALVVPVCCERGLYFKNSYSEPVCCERDLFLTMNSGARDAAQTGHKRQATKTGRHVVTQGSLGDGGVLRRRGEPELGRNLFRRRELQRD